MCQVQIQALGNPVALGFVLLAFRFPVKKHVQDFWVMKDCESRESPGQPYSSFNYCEVPDM